jgi:predicted permease
VISHVARDVRYALRMLRKSPGFTLAAVLTLGLGLGGNLAIFSIVNALFLRPMPLIREPGELAWVVGAERETGRTHAVSYPDARDLGRLRDAFAGIAAETHLELNFAATGAPSRISGLVVSGNYFTVLGVRPALGRVFLPDEDRTPGAYPVAVLSDALWRREFGEDSTAIGRPVHINGRAFTVVGVMPRGFAGTEFGERPPDVYVPVMMLDQLATQYHNALEERGLWVFSLIARLRPGVSLQQASAAVQSMAASRPPAGQPGDAVSAFRLLPMSGAMHPNDRSEGLAIAAIGLAVAAVVLLIACANVAALLLGRGTSRGREMAIRLALGANRRRLVRQLLTEGLLMALLASGAGLLLAAWTTSAAMAALGVPIQLDVSPDARVALSAIGLAIAAAVLFGTAPALAASRTVINPALSDGGAAAGMAPARRRLQRAFVVAQIALSLMLLASAGLLLRSMREATNADVGFDASDRVLTLSLDLAAQGYGPERSRAVSDLLLERVQALRGVRSASLAGLSPLGGVMWGTTAQVVEESSAAPRSIGLVFMNPLRPGFFATIGMRLKAGRDFSTRDDAAAPGVAIVSETMAKSAWPGRPPIGQRFRFGGDQAPWITVVGVASDMVDGPGERAQPFVYLPLLQRSGWAGAQALLVRSDSAAASLVPAVTAEVRRVDPTLPVFNVSTLKAAAAERLLPRRAGTTVVAAFGLLALGLAGIGLYGVVSHMVLQRRREIGVRIALGASQRAVVRLVLGEGVRLALAGLAAGIGLAAAATLLLASMFPSVGRLDAAALLAPAAVVTIIVLLASCLPARRAARLDPVAMLRND